MCGRFRKMLQREGEKTAISEKFYCVVIQAVLLFGVENWVLLATMTQRLEEVHIGLLRHVTKLKERRLKDDSWQKVAADRVIQGAGTKPLHTYLYRRQEIVAEWVTLQPIFEVCVRQTGYKGGENLWEPWWRQAAAEKQLKVTLEEISATARERWQRKFSRRDGGEGGEYGDVTDRNG